MVNNISNSPSTWVKATLGDVSFKIVDGSHNPPQKTEHGYPMLSARNIHDDQVVFNDYRFVSEEEFKKECERANVEENDILLTIVGTIGRTCVVPKNIQKFTLQRSVALIKPILINSKYVSYFLRTPYAKLFFKEKERGTAQKGIYLATINNFSIMLAPLPEQHRIVAKIEELFSELDKGVEALKTARQQLKVYRQAVLKWAFEGKLTEEWRKHQKTLPTASQLMEQIKAEREREAETTGKKLKPVDPINETELTELPELTDGWCWVRLVDVADKITDGEHFRPKTQEKGVYFLSAKDVRDEGVSFNDPLYISEETAKKALQRCNPEKDDILIVSRGATVGRSCIVNTKAPFCLLGSVILIKIFKTLSSRYVAAILKAPVANQKMISISGATAQQAIYLRDIQNIIIPLCPLEEQHAIVQEIETRLSVADKLEETITQSLQQAEALRQSILKKAFAGKLVPQDPSDEPASKLLERIKAEKAALAPVVKKSKINRT